MLTVAQLASGTGCSLVRAAKWHQPVSAAVALFGINTTGRLAAFLAQVGHESGRLVYVREVWGPTAAQRGYEGRVDLGNVHPGDGIRYKGRGLIQMTGRANYKATREGLRAMAQPSGDMTHVPDFELSPELLELPEWAALSAAWYWQNRGLNELADAGEFQRITRKINGGLNGYDDRLKLYQEGLRALGATVV